jgi:hypothetical protein
MIFDPLYVFLKSTGVAPIPLAIGYGFSFIIAMTIMLYISGRQKSVKEYFKDPLLFVWPFFVLAPIVIGYMLVSDLGSKIKGHLFALGLDYEDYSLRLEHLKILFWIILILSCIEGVESLIRYHKTRPKLWLSKPKFLQPISTVLFNIPLGVMALTLSVRLIDQWVTLHRFMTSGWLPSTVYSSDEMYGLRWLYTILLTIMTIAIVASFSSLLVLIREGKQKYSWIYKGIFLFSISCTGIALLTLSIDMNSLLQGINLHFLDIYISRLNQFSQFSPNTPLDITLQRMLLIQEITAIAEMPDSMPVPPWLAGIIGIRLIILIPEIYTTLAKPLGWKKFPLSIKKLFELVK